MGLCWWPDWGAILVCQQPIAADRLVSERSISASGAVLWPGPIGRGAALLSRLTPVHSLWQSSLLLAVYERQAWWSFCCKGLAARHALSSRPARASADLCMPHALIAGHAHMHCAGCQ